MDERRSSYRCLTPDGAQCELLVDHAEPHRNGLLIWHDPPTLYVDGKPYVAPTDPYPWPWAVDQ